VALPPHLAGPAAKDVNPDELKLVLTLSGNPFLRLSEAVDYMLHYPYGCIEQTSSGVMSLAALRGPSRRALSPTSPWRRRTSS